MEEEEGEEQYEKLRWNFSNGGQIRCNSNYMGLISSSLTFST